MRFVCVCECVCVCMPLERRWSLFIQLFLSDSDVPVGDSFISIGSLR